MAKFREIYAEQGAGINFINLNCMILPRIDLNTWARYNSAWVATPIPNLSNEYISTGELLVDCDGNPTWMNYPGNGLGISKTDDPELISLIETVNIIVASLKNKSISAEWWFQQLDLQLENNNFWKWNCTNYAIHFFKNEEEFLTIYGLDLPIWDLNTIRKMFIKGKEYFYSKCEQHNVDSYMGTHVNPYTSLSSVLQLPNNFKSLAIDDSDELMKVHTNMIFNIKHKTSESLKNNTAISNIEFADDTASYKKIFFENDEDEIRKLYEFFDTEEYFHINRINIMRQFKQYHQRNMELIKTYSDISYIKDL